MKVRPRHRHSSTTSTVYIHTKPTAMRISVFYIPTFVTVVHIVPWRSVHVLLMHLRTMGMARLCMGVLNIEVVPRDLSGARRDRSMVGVGIGLGSDSVRIRVLIVHSRRCTMGLIHGTRGVGDMLGGMGREHLTASWIISDSSVLGGVVGAGTRLRFYTSPHSRAAVALVRLLSLDR